MYQRIEIPQPEDKGILLRDIILSNVSDDHYHTQKAIDYMERGNDKWQQAGSRRADRYTQTIDKEKSFTLTQNFYKGVPYNYFEERPCTKREFSEDSTCHHAADAIDIKGLQSNKRIYASSGKAPSLTTCGGGHREPRY